jgi:hypothetical protein
MLEIIAVNHESKAAQEEQWRQIPGQDGDEDGDGQPQRAVAAGEIADHRCQEHEKETAANVRAAIRRVFGLYARRGRQGLTTLGALLEMSGYAFPAERTLSCGHARIPSPQLIASGIPAAKAI